MWRDALPSRFDRQLLGHTPLVTFVTSVRQSKVDIAADGAGSG
jgi:hypothetical protein